MTKDGKKKNSATMRRKHDRQEVPGTNLNAQIADKVGRDNGPVLQLYDEQEESEIGRFFYRKSIEWSSQYFESQVDTYKLLASGYEDDERITWIKNLFYVLQKHLAHGASNHDAYIRGQWKCACRLMLMPAWSSDSVEEFHLHLRRWDTDRSEEPDIDEADEREGMRSIPILPIEYDMVVPAPMAGCFGRDTSVGSVAASEPVGVLKTVQRL